MGINAFLKRNISSENEETKIHRLTEQFFSAKNKADETYWHTSRTDEDRKRLFHDYDGAEERRRNATRWEEQAVASGFFGTGPILTAKMALGRAKKCEIDHLTKKSDVFIPKKDSQSILSNEEINKYYPIIVKPMTTEEKNEFDSSSDIFSAMQSYYRRIHNGETPLVYDLRRDNLPSAMAMVNAGANDFNSTTAYPDSAFQITPSICLESQFSGYLNDYFIFPTSQKNNFSDTNFSCAEKHFKEFRDLNDILYIYGKIKQNGNGLLNNDAIKRYQRKHPQDARRIERSLLQMDRLVAMNEKDRIRFFITNIMQASETTNTETKAKKKINFLIYLKNKILTR